MSQLGRHSNHGKDGDDQEQREQDLGDRLQAPQRANERTLKLKKTITLWIGRARTNNFFIPGLPNCQTWSRLTDSNKHNFQAFINLFHAHLGCF